MMTKTAAACVAISAYRLVQTKLQIVIIFILYGVVFQSIMSAHVPIEGYPYRDGQTIIITHETTPLLSQRRSNCTFLYVFFLIFMFVLGMSIGIYLLIPEVEHQPDEISAIVMDDLTLARNGSLNYSTSVDFVDVSQITYNPCETNDNCTDIQLNGNTMEFDRYSEFYNFFLNEEGRIWILYGWDRHCSVCNPTTLHIGIKRPSNSTTEKQRIQFRKLLNEGISKKKLSSCPVITFTEDFRKDSITNFTHIWYKTCETKHFDN